MHFPGKTRLVMGALILVAAPLVTLAQATGDPLCGSTLVEDLVLDHNVTCYDTDGLIVGADGITIDLNGKKILCRECRKDGLVGIDASRFHDIVIKGPGAVSGFEISLRVNSTELVRDGRPGLQPAGSLKAPSTRVARPVSASRIAARSTKTAKTPPAKTPRASEEK